MSQLETNRAILQSMMERDVENLYANIKNTVINSIPQQYRLIAKNYIRANEGVWIEKMQGYVDTLVIASFPSPETTLEEAIDIAGTTLNDIVGNFLQEKLGLDLGSVNIALSVLFGNRI